MKRFILAITMVMVGFSAAASGGKVTFAAGKKPQVTRTDGKVQIAFALSAASDVEVAVLDQAGKVVRHLAAGVLGGDIAPPPPLKPGLRQELTWDGQDDDGKPAGADLSKFKARVRVGLTAKLGRVIGEPGRVSGNIYGLATDAQGNLYVASGCIYTTPVFTIKAFDRAGRYLRTVLPMPASLKLDQAAEYGGVREVDGHLVPGNFNALVPYVQEGGITAFIGNTVRGGVLWLLNSDGSVCRIRTDGSAVQWKSAPKTRGPSGGPMCWAVGAEGSGLYFTGWWNQRATGAGDSL